VINRQSVLANSKLGAWLRRDQAGIRHDLERCFDLFPPPAERRHQLPDPCLEESSRSGHRPRPDGSANPADAR
jgi:hypothetical protein